MISAAVARAMENFGEFSCVEFFNFISPAGGSRLCAVFWVHFYFLCSAHSYALFRWLVLLYRSHGVTIIGKLVLLFPNLLFTLTKFLLCKFLLFPTTSSRGRTRAM